ncbi:MAG: UDP-2,3-diacylglucosamine diphosphatase [Betaproteobacteria bacterium HGW-Betaproteobacteria-1]|jgi:UDP-2,3-diacylglucosamine hydrolase|nr:MAG: UDP-2,3-diacylglucosamine diphosphatase [Betaproteobacteria bacterium HGW-Betaproteobacteria-1]
MQPSGNEDRHTLLISDLHLCASRPAITDQFVRFIDTTARRADALYILGDLFEYWAGDDDLADPHNQTVIQALKRLSTHSVSCYLIHGNRDFLLGNEFAETANLQILQDPTMHDLHGYRVLLSHGDALCTDDLAYQEFRQQVRHPAWQAQFLAQPLSARKAQIEALRMRSEQEKSGKSEVIMDVNQDAVFALLRAYDYPDIFIHGHTHRPARHDIEIDRHHIVRWVLGDWYEQGSCLRLDTDGCKALPLV